MLLLYYPPFRAETDDELLTYALAGLEDYIDDLKEFPPEIVANAWRQVRRDHKLERWPAIKPWRDACLAQMATPGKPQQFSQSQPGSSWEERQRAREKDRDEQAEEFAREWCLFDPLGQEADRNGWGKFLRREIAKLARAFIGGGSQAFEIRLDAAQIETLRIEGAAFLERQARRDADGGAWLFGKFIPTQEKAASGR